MFSKSHGSCQKFLAEAERREMEFVECRQLGPLGELSPLGLPVFRELLASEVRGTAIISFTSSLFLK